MADGDGADHSYYRLATAFEVQLHAPIREGLVVAGRFLRPARGRRGSHGSGTADGLLLARAPPPALCLAAATSGQRVIVHNNNSHAAAVRQSTRHSAAAAAAAAVTAARSRHAARDTDVEDGSSGSVGYAAGGVGETALQTLTFAHELTALAAGRLRQQHAHGSGDSEGDDDNDDDSDDDAAAADVLLLGAASSVFAYDVDRNKQLFYKAVDEGVRALACGPVKTTTVAAAAGGGAAHKDRNRSAGAAVTCPVLAVMGGNCVVYGLDAYGTERYWTVTGEQVSALAMLPWRTSPSSSSSSSSSAAVGGLAVLAASEDCEVRVFDGEEVVTSIVEVARVRQLVPAWHATTTASSSLRTRAAAARRRRRRHRLGPSQHDKDDNNSNGDKDGNDDNVDDDDDAAAATTTPSRTVGRFAYLLDNGTVGVYAHGERVWRIKGRSVPVAAAFCDVDGDGVDELVIGWRSGRIEVRSDAADVDGGGGGGVLFRDMAAAPVAAVLAEDYRGDGCRVPLVCTVDGTVRGLAPLQNSYTSNNNGNGHNNGNNNDGGGGDGGVVSVAAAQARARSAVAALSDERRRLQEQLALLRAQTAAAAAQRGAAGSSRTTTTMPDAGTRVVYTCTPNVHTRKLDVVLRLRAGNDTERATSAHDDDDNEQNDDVGQSCGVIQSCVLRCDADEVDGTCGAAAAALGAGVEAVCVYADTPSSRLTCSLDWPHDAAATLLARVAVGLPYVQHCQVHTLRVAVPSFVMYAAPRALVRGGHVAHTHEVLSGTPPSGHTTLRFAAPLRLAALSRWLREMFGLDEDDVRVRGAHHAHTPRHGSKDDDGSEHAHTAAAAAAAHAAVQLRVELLHVRDGGSVCVEARNDEGDDGGSSTLTVHAETMETCGDVLSALSRDMVAARGAFATGGDSSSSSSDGGLSRLLDTTLSRAAAAARTSSLLVELECAFARELQQLRSALQRIATLDEVRVKLTTDMADAATSLRTMHACADDARVLADVAALRTAHTRILEVNRELLGEEAKRRANDAEQQALLKEVHTLIYRSSRVRLGSAREAIVSACRVALRDGAHNKLVELVRQGIA